MAAVLDRFYGTGRRKTSVARVWIRPGAGLKNHPFARLTVHHDQEWLRELQVPHASLFLHRLLRLQPRPVYGPFSRIRIHREVAHLKRHQVLKEMASLRRDHPKIAKARLDDNAGARNFVPLYRNPQPRIVRSQPSHPNQNVRAVLQGQPGVELRDRAGHFLAASAFKAVKAISIPAQIYRWKAAPSTRQRAKEVQDRARDEFVKAFADGLAVLGYERDEKGNGKFLLGKWGEC